MAPGSLPPCPPTPSSAATTSHARPCGTRRRRSTRRSGSRGHTSSRRYRLTTSRRAPPLVAARRQLGGNGRCSTRAWGWWSGRASHTSHMGSGARRWVSVPPGASSWCDCDRAKNSGRTGCRPRAASRSRRRHRRDRTRRARAGRQVAQIGDSEATHRVPTLSHDDPPAVSASIWGRLAASRARQSGQLQVSAWCQPPSGTSVALM